MGEIDRERLSELGLTGPDLERASSILEQFRQRVDALRALDLLKEPRLEQAPLEGASR